VGASRLRVKTNTKLHIVASHGKRRAHLSQTLTCPFDVSNANTTLHVNKTFLRAFKGQSGFSYFGPLRTFNQKRIYRLKYVTLKIKYQHLPFNSLHKWSKVPNRTHGQSNFYSRNQQNARNGYIQSSCRTDTYTYTGFFRRNSKYFRRWQYGLFRINKFI